MLGIFASINIFAQNEPLTPQQLDSITLMADEDELYANEHINWHRLFDVFINSQNKLINHTMVNLNVGISSPSLPDKLNMEPLPTSNYFNFEYGFVRLDSAYRYNRLRSYSGEFAFIEQNTNDYGVFSSKNKVYANHFLWGAGLRSGYGTRLFDDSEMELYWLHSSAFVWTYSDYDQYSEHPFFEAFDQEYKFGNRGAATIEYRVNNCFLIDLTYEHTNYYSGMEYGKWIGTWFIDFALQRWIDLLDPLFIKDLGYTYPFVKFFYKNAISIILSEARLIKQYFPFKSDYSLLDRRLGVGIRFIF
jgi:hypothetical protein